MDGLDLDRVKIYGNLVVPLEKMQAEKINVTYFSHHCQLTLVGLVLHPRMKEQKKSLNFAFFLSHSASLTLNVRLFQWNSTWEIPSFDTLTALVCVVRDNQ